MLIRELLFADDYALWAHSLEDIEGLVDMFATAAKRSGLTIILRKTKVMFQPHHFDSHHDSAVTAEGTKHQWRSPAILEVLICLLMALLTMKSLKTYQKPVQLSVIWQVIWQVICGRAMIIKLTTKISVYRAAVLSTLLYGCETWASYRKHVQWLEASHMCCLLRRCNIRWQ